MLFCCPEIGEAEMVTVEVRRNGVKIVGHTRYAELGKDIVCSAISALFENLILSLEELTKDKARYEIVPGNSSMTHEVLTPEGRLLKNSFLLGVRAVAEEYPDYVTVQFKESL